jgi:hypothetical protein
VAAITIADTMTGPVSVTMVKAVSGAPRLIADRPAIPERMCLRRSTMQDHAYCPPVAVLPAELPGK